MSWFILSSCIVATTFVLTLPLLGLEATPLECITLAVFSLTLGYGSRKFYEHAFPKLSFSPPLSLALSANLLVVVTLYESFSSSVLPYNSLLYVAIFLMGFLWLPTEQNPKINFTISIVTLSALGATYVLGLGKSLYSFAVLFLILCMVRIAIEGKRLQIVPLIGGLLILGVLPFLKKEEKEILFKHRGLDSVYQYKEEAPAGALPSNRLVVNEAEKFSSSNEQQRYLCLVSLPLQLQRLLTGIPKKVLILGGADGLAARNALGFSAVKEIVVVDLQEELFEKAKNELKFRMYNLDSLKNPKTSYVKKEPLKFLHQLEEKEFDVILMDTPSNDTPSFKRYTTLEFLRSVEKSLKDNGVAVLTSEVGIPSKTHFQSLKYQPLSDETTFTLLAKSSTSLPQLFNSLVQGPLKLPCKRNEKKEQLYAPPTLSTLLKEKR